MYLVFYLIFVLIGPLVLQKKINAKNLRWQLQINLPRLQFFGIEHNRDGISCSSKGLVHL